MEIMNNIIQSVLNNSLEMKIAVSPPGWSGTVQKMLDDHPEIDNPWALCFTGDTKIPLLDGRTVSIKDR